MKHWEIGHKFLLLTVVEVVCVTCSLNTNRKLVNLECIFEIFWFIHVLTRDKSVCRANISWEFGFNFESTGIQEFKSKVIFFENLIIFEVPTFLGNLIILGDLFWILQTYYFGGLIFWAIWYIYEGRKGNKSALFLLEGDSPSIHLQSFPTTYVS